jgi:hypothetical protein
MKETQKNFNIGSVYVDLGEYLGYDEHLLGGGHKFTRSDLSVTVVPNGSPRLVSARLMSAMEIALFLDVRFVHTQAMSNWANTQSDLA